MGLTRLDRGEPEPARPAPAPAPDPHLLLVPPPGVLGTVTLHPDEPVVRLDALQSGIGALLIRGATAVAWEDTEDRSGVVRPDGSSIGDDVPEYGNRSLLRPLDGEVIVTLRHVRHLNRLLIEAPVNAALSLVPYCAGTVRAADPDTALHLSVVVVDGRLEIRTEVGLPADLAAALSAMGWSPLASIPRPAPQIWQ